MNIHPTTLSVLRTSRDLSQEGLAERSKVAKATISRIERGKSGSANTATIERLARALEVPPKTLTEPPEAMHEADLRELGYRTIKVTLKESTFEAFVMAQRRYGVHLFDQIEMAPLFFTLLAEGSLAWRRKKVEEAWEAATRLRSIGSGAGHLAFVNAVNRTEEGLAEEEQSIESLDLFGKDVGDDAFHLGFDPSESNPFADYLRHLARDIDPDVVELDTEGKGIWKTGEGMPEYTICPAELNRIEEERGRIAGGNHLARYALKRGHVLPRDIPQELQGEDAKEARIAWLIERIPKDEREREEARWSELEAIIASLDASKDAGESDA
jgi:transcriptional regulator with XRE-family HTH domain